MDLSNHYSFSIIRYVPNVVREEFINIGVVITDMSGARPPLARLTCDWTRLRLLDQGADVETLQALERDINLQSVEKGTSEAFLDSVRNSFSNNIQITQSRGRAAQSMDMLMDELMGLYVDSPVRSTLFAVAGGY